MLILLLRKSLKKIQLIYFNNFKTHGEFIFAMSVCPKKNKINFIFNAFLIIKGEFITNLGYFMKSVHYLYLVRNHYNQIW